jgi:hypothetical protein
MIEACLFEMNGLHTQATLNILPLGSYDVLIGMVWLNIYKEKLNFHDKTLECEYSEGNTRVLQGIHNHVSMKKISALQLKKFSQKGCPLYEIQVLNAEENNELKIEDHSMPWEFKYVFPEEVLELPPK